MSTGYLTVNTPPSISVVEPKGSDDSVIYGTNFSVQFSGSDEDDTAIVSLYHNSSASGCIEGDLSGWTSFADNLPKTTTSGNFSAPAAGTYYICSVINDGADSSFAVSDSLVVNANIVPTLTIDAPTGTPKIAELGTFNLNYTAADIDSVALVNLYYSSTNLACEHAAIGNWVNIGSNLTEGIGLTSLFLNQWGTMIVRFRVPYILCNFPVQMPMTTQL